MRSGLAVHKQRRFRRIQCRRTNKSGLSRTDSLALFPEFAVVTVVVFMKMVFITGAELGFCFLGLAYSKRDSEYGLAHGTSGLGPLRLQAEILTGNGIELPEDGS